jgi:glycine/D-amino acid oxidase-like deaminating enzyme
MDLRSVYPFWLLDKGILASYPSVARNMQADVVIVGAGISGALMSWYLRHTNMKVIIVDKRHVGMGSTAATTGLIQYEIDTPLTVLEKKAGAAAARESYLWCQEAIDELAAICKQFPEAAFTPKPSLQYASWKKHVAPLYKEYQARKALGIDLQWLEEEDIKNRFGFRKHAGLLSGKAAELNAYSLTHCLLQQCSTTNLQIFDHTNIKTIRRQRKGFNLYTTAGYRISTRYLVIACGYESARYLPKKVNSLHTTYAIVSEPFATNRFWYKNALIWETAFPYLYLRTTSDNRILIGGKDNDFSSPIKRERALPDKAAALEMAFKRLFPHLPFKTDFKWAGAFSSTKDGLPYIGSFPGKKDIYFALGFGGNGIVFSVIAARIISRLLAGNPHPRDSIFGFNR